MVKLWKPDGTSTTLWEKDFGGKFSRMRDLEVADVNGDGFSDIAVATHDQGVVAVLWGDGAGGFTVEELDADPNTFVHEVEVGDLDGDGVLEIYATPSLPNKLDGTPQPGFVTRYVPGADEPEWWWPTSATATPRRSWSTTSTATAPTSSTSRWRRWPADGSRSCASTPTPTRPRAC